MYVSFIFMAFFFGYSIAVTPVSAITTARRITPSSRAPQKEPDRHAHHEPCDDGLVHPAGKPHRTSFRRLRRGAVRHDGQRAAHLALSFLVCGFNIFGSAFFTGLNNGTASALISFLRTLVIQVAAVLLCQNFSHQRHLARHHRGRSAHTDRHCGALPRGAQKVSLRLTLFHDRYRERWTFSYFSDMVSSEET